MSVRVRAGPHVCSRAAPPDNAAQLLQAPAVSCTATVRTPPAPGWSAPHHSSRATCSKQKVPTAPDLTSPTMSRNRTYGNGFSAQLRFGSMRTVDIDLRLSDYDSVLRRASSIAKFVLRMERVAGRRELLISIAGVRHTSTDRADSAILPLLRRLRPEVRRRHWSPLLAADGSVTTESVFADYAILPEADAEAAMRNLQSAPATADTVVAATDLPPAIDA